MKVKVKSQKPQEETVKDINLNYMSLPKPVKQPTVLSRMVAIIHNDICVFFNINRKERENKMIYNDFMERFK